MVSDSPTKETTRGMYLIPVLLDTPFCPLWEGLCCLSVQVQELRILLACHFISPTFAISLHEFPASLICFSLSSSAGVQGVFVRLFLTLGSWAAVSPCSVWSDAALFWASAPALASAMLLACWPALRDLRFR